MKKFTEKSSARVQQLAHRVSTMFHPMWTLPLFFLVNAFSKKTASALETVLTPVLIFMLIYLFLRWKMHTGVYADADVSDRQQRKGLYWLLTGILICYLAYSCVIKGSVETSVLFLTVLMALLQTSNYFIKSSMHTALNLYVAGLFSTLNIFVGVLWLLITVFVAVSRLVLQKHTITEIWAGTAAGAIISLLFLYCYLSFGPAFHCVLLK